MIKSENWIGSDQMAVDINGVRTDMEAYLNSLKPRKRVHTNDWVDYQTRYKYWDFNRFRLNDGQDYLSSGVAYAFFTRPHLNLLRNKNILDPFLRSVKEANNNSVAHKLMCDLDGLQGGSGNSSFIKVLTNSIESFECKDTVLKTREVGETFLGDKMSWGDTSIESTGPDTFTIEYTEYSDMSITLLHKIWLDYINAVKIDKIRPYRANKKNKADNDAADYILEKKLDYASSMYYFLTDADGTTIKYFAKYTGVFPISVPYSAMSFKLGESSVKKLSVQYQYSFKEDMNPEILEEFAFLTYTTSINPYSQDIDSKAHKTWNKYVRISADRKKLIFIN